MNRNNRILVIVTIITLIMMIAVATYAFFASGNFNVTNAANISALTERNNMVFDTIGGEMSLNVTAANMTDARQGNVAAENNTILTVNFTPNTSYSVVCTYDIVYEWTSNDKYTTHTSGVTDNEYTIQGVLASNEHAIEGTNSISSETDLATLSYTNNSVTVVSGARIDGIGNTTSTAVWTLSSKFYNVNADQSALSGKTYSSRFKVANVSCVKGNVNNTQTLVDYLINSAPKSGTDAISNSPWILTSDHPGEWRYAGKNPDNYILFNDELWLIVGVMPNMEYCTGTYGTSTECDTTTTGSLVKITRNRTIPETHENDLTFDKKSPGVGSAVMVQYQSDGSNDWSDSQLMLMLNGTNYLTTAYDANGNRLHTGYSITNNMVSDSNGYNFYDATYSYLYGTGTSLYTPTLATTSSYTPEISTADILSKIQSSALNKIATVRWDLYGSPSNESSPSDFYNMERNINNTGSVFNVTDSGREKRAVKWYGKIGLLYPSDTGYATNGSGNVDRSTCLQTSMANYASCALGDYLRYQPITYTFQSRTGTCSLTLTPSTNGRSDQVYSFCAGTSLVTATVSQYNTHSNFRPALYLNSDVNYLGGTGTWDDPYRIENSYQLGSPVKYWYPSDEMSNWSMGSSLDEPSYYFPYSGGSLYSSGPATGHYAYIGQDYTDYYACATETDSNKEVCLSQPYTKYGLQGHTPGNDFTSTQGSGAVQAIYQAFDDAGITVDINNDCYYEGEYAYCYISGFICFIDKYGEVGCSSYNYDDNTDTDRSSTCVLDRGSIALCTGWYYS